MDNSGSHCSEQKDFDVDLSYDKINLCKIVMKESEKTRYYISLYFETIKIPSLKRCIYKIKYTFYG